MTDRSDRSQGSNLVPADPTVPGFPDGSPFDEQAQPEGSSFQIGRLFSAILRYKWLVLVITAAGTAAAVAATRFIEPRFLTSGTIYIDPGSNRGGPIRPEELLQDANWTQLLRSFAVVDPVIRRTKSYLEVPPQDSSVFSDFELAPRYRPGEYRLTVDANGRRFSLQGIRGIAFDSGAVGDSIGRALGFQWAPRPAALGRDRDVRFTVKTIRDASTELLNRLVTTLTPGAVFMRVSMGGTDPQRSAHVLNALMKEFVDLASRLKREKLVQLTADLENQLRTADSSMRGAETALEAYRIKTITEPREEQVPLPSGLAQTQGTVMSGHFQKRVQLAAIQKDRKSIEELLRRGREEGAVPVDAFHTITSIRAAPGLVGVLGEITTTEAELRALRLRYTDEYSEIKKLIAKLDGLQNQTLPVYAQRLVEQLKRDEQDLQQTLTSETDELRKIPVRTMTEEKYRREAQAAIALTQNLQNHLTNARLATLSATPDVSILDPAEAPSRPSKNTAPRIILMGFASALGFALALAILLDRIDKRFRYPEQATHDLGLTILGAVPVIRGQRMGLRSPAETAQIVEAFRSIRLSLAHSFPPNAPLVFTVTSPGPGDGKSLIASNLALSFADAGYETLLIDADTRRGEQHKTFQVERRPGLLDHLEMGLATDVILHPTAHDRLMVLPSGSRIARGPELLGSSRMADLVAQMRRRYDVIILDTPPLAAGVDPFVLGTCAGAVAVVLRAGSTDRQLAEAKLRLMERLPTRLLGAILNHVDAGHGAYKYYVYEYNPEGAGTAAEAVVDEAVIPARESGV